MLPAQKPRLWGQRLHKEPLTEAAWTKIARLYQYEEVGVSQLAVRFSVSAERIRAGLAERGIKRKKQKCGDSASTN